MVFLGELLSLLDTTVFPPLQMLGGLHVANRCSKIPKTSPLFEPHSMRLGSQRALKNINTDNEFTVQRSVDDATHIYLKGVVCISGVFKVV